MLMSNPNSHACIAKTEHALYLYVITTSGTESKMCQLWQPQVTTYNYSQYQGEVGGTGGFPLLSCKFVTGGSTKANSLLIGMGS